MAFVNVFISDAVRLFGSLSSIIFLNSTRPGICFLSIHKYRHNHSASDINTFTNAIMQTYHELNVSRREAGYTYTISGLNKSSVIDAFDKALTSDMRPINQYLYNLGLIFKDVKGDDLHFLSVV